MNASDKETDKMNVSDIEMGQEDFDISYQCSRCAR